MDNRIPSARKQYLVPLLIVLLFSAIGVALFLAARAASVSLSMQPEGGTVTAPAVTLQDATASDSKAVRFATGGISPSPPTTGPAAGKSIVFSDEFDTKSVGLVGSKWAFTSNSYEFGDRNPNKDSKLDWLTPTAMTVANGEMTITATPRGDGYWNTGFLTTEPRNDMSKGGSGYRLQPGDFYVMRSAMPTGNTGAWPALWTWQPNYANWAGEIDVFEYHSDNPHLLETGNRPGGVHKYYENATLVKPGQYVWVGVLAGTNNNDYYVGATLDTMIKFWSDGYGMRDARPYLIACLSISNGQWHPKPVGTAPITYKIDSIRVYH